MKIDDLKIYVICDTITGELWGTAGNKWYWKRQGDAKNAYLNATGQRFDHPNLPHKLHVVELGLYPLRVCS